MSFSNGTVPVTQDVVLKAVVTRLIAQLPQGFTANNVYVSMHPDWDEIERSQNEVIQVSPLDGNYDGNWFEGVGTPLENTAVVVTYMMRHKLDRMAESERALYGANPTQSNRSLLEMKRRILKALSNYMLTNADGENILVDYMEPLSVARPAHDRETWADIALTFGTNFVWDLTT